MSDAPDSSVSVETPAEKASAFPEDRCPIPIPMKRTSMSRSGNLEEDNALVMQNELRVELTD